VVRDNLKNSFPKKSVEELHEIERKYYHNLCDWIIETIKLFSISEAELRRGIPFEDLDLYNSLFKQNRHLIVAAGHFNNFEWLAQGFTIVGDFQIIGLFTPLSNKYFNRFMLKNRSRFGGIMIPAKEIGTYLKNPPQKISAIGFVTDQSPRKDSNVYWTEFLSQETACFTGVERYAVKLNAPVVFLYPIKIKRGQYVLRMRMISDEPHLAHPFAITESTTRFLEDLIHQQPEAWMWSHKRWKLKRPPLPQFN
jgi:KDO2-lipid IV(A) lauroyltransferase